MANSNLKNIGTKLTLWGILLGVLLRGFTIFLEISHLDLGFSYEGLVAIHKNNSLNYLLDVFPPLILGIAGNIIGVVFRRYYIANNETISSLKSRKNEIFQFVELLRKGDVKNEIDFSQEDDLGRALVNLKNELIQNKLEDETRKREDFQRQWTSEGLARFGAILRDKSKNIEELSENVISNLVKYLNAKQAGFFIIDKGESGEKTIRQVASFAYNRKKYTDKVIIWGEGLIGACILEKQTIFIEEVSENYVEITSGLGKANPRCLLIVPLKTEEDEIHGAIEIAAFEVYKQFEIEFIEKVAESIAITITNLNTSLRTEKLLSESREQGRELAKQEQQMSSAIEDMKKMTLDAAKQSEQFVSFTNSVNHTMIRAEYDKTGILIYANTKFLEILDYKNNSEVEGKHISTFINKKDRIWFDELWETIIKGGQHFEGDMKHLTKSGKDVWTISTYVSVRDAEGNPEKVLFLGIDTTESKKQSLDYEGQINALNHSSLYAEYSPKGEVLDYNNKLLDLLGFSLEDIKDKTIFDFLSAEEADNFKVIWANILEGVPFEGRIKRNAKNGTEKWFYGTFSIVRDIYDEISKIIFIGNDVTVQRQMEEKNREQNKILTFQEEKLQQAKLDLSRKLKQSREEMKMQFREIETVKLLNEKTLEGMLDAIVTINQDNIVEFFNKAAEDLWGLSRDAILGKAVDVLLPKKHAEQGQEYMGHYFKIGDNMLINTRKEVFIIDKNGEQVYILLTLSEAGIGLRYRLTAFIQRIEVELF